MKHFKNFKDTSVLLEFITGRATDENMQLYLK